MRQLPPFSSVIKSREVEDPVNLWLHRPIAYAVVAAIHRTAITPNQMTFVAMLVGFAAGAMWIIGSPTLIVVGGVLLWTSSILDGVDGILARAKGLGSDVGRALDGTADVLVVFATVLPAYYYLLLHSPTPMPGLVSAMAFAVVTTVPQIFLYDYYKEVYLHATKPGSPRRPETTEKAEARVRDARERGAPWWVMFALNAYVGILKNQQRLVGWANPAVLSIERSATTERSAALYRQYNQGPMQLWTLVSLCPHSYLLALSAIFGRLELYLWFRVIGANLLFVIVLIWQRVASNRTLATAKREGWNWPPHHGTSLGSRS